MQWVSKCFYCNHSLYQLGDGMLKCSHCHKKFSKERVNKIITLICAYIDEESALSLSNRLALSYISVKNYYESFRVLGATISEREYEKIRDKACEYEEYFYLENSKKSKKENVFDAHNFLTFDYNGYIYTLLMPSLHQYKQQFIDDNIENAYINEFTKFKRISRIIKVSKQLNNIVKFWEYFESSILKYKGVKNDSFVYYLKEMEFKYNHTKKESIELLINEYFKGQR
jgi:transposase